MYLRVYTIRIDARNRQVNIITRDAHNCEQIICIRICTISIYHSG